MNLSKEAIAAIVVIYQMGQGMPTYLLSGHDIIDAIVEGLVEERDQSLYLTLKGQMVIKSIIEKGELPAAPKPTGKVTH